jgi:hypothetical protein
VQVLVEDASGAARTYTLLRDELGTVMGLVAEDEGSDPANPPVPVRYRYSPYGEAHVESGPELLRAHFDAEAEAVEISSGAVTQTVSDETAAAAGALVLDWSVSLDSATLPAGLSVERLASGSGWVPLAPEQVAVGLEPTDGGISSGGGGPPSLLVLAREGWLRGTSYRVRLTGALKDQLGRRFGRTESLEWRVPEAPAAVTFDKKIPARFESWEAAKDDLGGRFPVVRRRSSRVCGPIRSPVWLTPVRGGTTHATPVGSLKIRCSTLTAPICTPSWRTSPTWGRTRAARASFACSIPSFVLAPSPQPKTWRWGSSRFRPG